MNREGLNGQSFESVFFSIIEDKLHLYFSRPSINFLSMKNYESLDTFTTKRENYDANESWVKIAFPQVFQRHTL